MYMNAWPRLEVQQELNTSFSPTTVSRASLSINFSLVCDISPPTYCLRIAAIHLAQNSMGQHLGWDLLDGSSKDSMGLIHAASSEWPHSHVWQLAVYQSRQKM